MRLLLLSQLRNLLRHKLQSLLAVLGIALGVAIVNTVDISNYSAKQNICRAERYLSDQADYRILSSSGTIDEQLYAKLRRDWLSLHPTLSLNPILSSRLKPANRDQRDWTVLAIDPLSYQGIHKPNRLSGAELDLSSLIGSHRALVISSSLANKRELSLGDTLTLALRGENIVFTIAGILAMPDAYQQLLLMDIGQAQQLLALEGRLSYIDVNIDSKQPFTTQQLQHELSQQLPAGLQLLAIEQLIEGQLELSHALEFNLSAIGLLAMAVGGLLIFSTVRFSVLQRLPLFVRMRIQGASQREILWILLLEATLLAVIGILLGWLLGGILAQHILPLTQRSLNQLYNHNLLLEASVNGLLYAKTAVLGLGCALLSASLSFRMIQQAPLSHSIKRIQQELRVKQQRRFYTYLALACSIIAAFILASGAASNLLQSYIGASLAIVAALLLSPGLCRLGLIALQALFTRFSGPIGRITLRDLMREDSRITLAVIALTLAVAASTGIATMVDSFRSTVESWLDSELVADIYLRSNLPSQAQSAITPQRISELKNLGPEELSFSRLTTLQFAQHTVTLVARDHWITNSISGNPSKALEDKGSTRDEIVISEALANKLELKINTHIKLPTPSGEKPFRISAIFRDYSTEYGRIIISRESYRQYWQDDRVDSIGFYLAPQQTRQFALSTLQDWGDKHAIRLIDSNTVRQGVLAVFDDTFAITQVLRILVLLIAAVAIISTLMIYQIQRRDQLLTLRTLGMSTGELRLLFIIQGAVIGAISGLLSVPLGLLIAWLLTSFINPAAFGWSLDFSLQWSHCVSGIAIAIIAGLVSALYPCWRYVRLDSLRANTYA